MGRRRATAASCPRVLCLSVLVWHTPAGLETLVPGSPARQGSGKHSPEVTLPAANGPVCLGDLGPWDAGYGPQSPRAPLARPPGGEQDCPHRGLSCPAVPLVGKLESVAIFSLLSGPYLATVCRPEARVSLLAAPHPHPPWAQHRWPAHQPPSASETGGQGLPPALSPRQASTPSATLTPPEGRCDTPRRAGTVTTVVIVTCLCSAPC